MADREVWRDMAAQFGALDPERRLSALWASTGHGESGNYWLLVGAHEEIAIDEIPNEKILNEEIKERFTCVAERAAGELGHRGAGSALFIWLNLVKRNSPGHAQRDNGRIEYICEASANYCLKLATQDIQAEAVVPQDSNELIISSILTQTRHAQVPIFQASDEQRLLRARAA
jgi:hypothetical protein